MTPDELNERQRYVALCNPEQPLVRPDDPLYEPLDQGEPVRGGDGPSCIDELGRTIAVRGPTAATCQLFTGFTGSGKTTELYRLKAVLEADKIVPTHVVFVEFDRYVDQYTPISITDILRVLAYVLDREATAEEAIRAGKDPDAVEGGYGRRLFDFVARADVQIKSLGFDAYGTKLMFEIKDNPRFRERVQAALDLRFQTFAREAIDMVTEAIVRLRSATGAQRIVVIADDLEKLTYLREEDREKAEEAAETTFVTHASWLRLPVHVIYTFPFWLRFRVPKLGALFDEEPTILPMVKIADEDGRPYLPGIQKLVHLVGRRVKLQRAFGPSLEETLHPIIEASGGYPRDMLRMIRSLLTAAQTLPVTAAESARVIQRIREAYAMTVRAADADLLVEIARTHALPDGDRPRLAAFGRLVENCLVLAYRNGSERYDLHPLVREVPMVKRRLIDRE